MAIENTYLLGKNITLGCGFDLQAKAPLDSRQTVPAFAGLQALIDGNAAYEGMIVYDEETKKTYQAQIVDDVLAFREFGINEAELKDLIASETTAAMEFKGAATALPENPAKGDMYKVTASFKIGEEDVKVGDSIVYDGEQWFIIPSGDDIEDTWRPVTGVDNDSALTFDAGDKLEKTVAADGTITYKHVAIDAPTDMTAEDDEKTRTYITQLITDNYGHIIGFKTATENVEDTNTTYEFEGLPVAEDEGAPSSVYFQVKSSEEEAADVIYLDTYSKNEVDGKFNALGTMATESADDFVKKGETITFEGDDNEEGASFDKDSLHFSHMSGSNGIGQNGLYGSGDGSSFRMGYDDVGTFVISESAEYEGDHPVATAFNEFLGVDKKVDKVEGYSLVSDTEIARLAKVDNYDDEEVRGLIGDNADAIAAINDADTGILKQAKDYADGKDEAIEAAQSAADKAQEEVDALETYVGTIPTDEKYADITNVISYVNKKAEETLAAAQGGSSETAASVKQQLDNYKSENDTRVKAAEDAIDAVEGRMDTAEGKITALETASATHATKDELGTVDAKFANYNTTVAQKAIDDAQDAKIKAIADDYVKAADIADFETKENVKKVADDLAAYVESNDAALAAETKARTEADAGFETRIAALEGNFGDGEGTVEAQIAAAVDAEKQRAEGIEGGLRTDVDAVKADYLKSTDKTELSDAIGAEKTRAEGIEAGLRTDVDAIKGDYLKGADKTALQEQITANANAITLLTDGADPDKVDGVKDLIDYVDKHGTEVTGMKADIAANTKAIEDEASRADTAEKALAGRLDTLEAIDHNAYVAADTALKAELNAEIAKKADASTLTAMDEAYKAADTALAGRIKDLEDNKAGYATTGEVATAKGEAIAAAETKAGELDAALKTELQKEIDDDVKALADTVYTKDEIVAMFTWGSF